MGAQLRVGRPSKWSGPPDNHGNWEDVLAKYMSGELQAGNTAPGQGAAAMNANVMATRVVELQNMLSNEDLANEEEYNDLLEDTREECGQFGQLLDVVIPKAGEAGATKIFLEYASTDDASEAIRGLEGRTFDGQRVQATFFDEEKFSRKDFA